MEKIPIINIDKIIWRKHHKAFNDNVKAVLTVEPAIIFGEFRSQNVIIRIAAQIQRCCYQYYD